MSKRLLWVWRVGLSVAVVGSLSWLGYQYFGVGGSLVLTYQFDHSGGLISSLSPHGRALDLERNQENGESYQRLVGEPAYFTAQLPSAFERVRVTMEYQNPNQTVVELGVKRTADPLVWDYQMQPLENKFVDASTWSTLTNDYAQLLQRTATYQSVDDFLQQPPTNKHIGTYLFDPEALPFIDETYAPSAAESNVTVPLIGKHDVYLYAADEDLDFTTEFTGLGDVTLAVWFRGNLIEEVPAVSATSAHLHLNNVDAGVYHIVVQAPDTVIFTRTQSQQERMVFGKQVTIGNTEGVSITSPADATIFIPLNSQGVQTAKAIDGVISLPRVNEPITWVNPLPWQSVVTTLPTGNVRVIADAYIALPGSEQFDPWFGFKTINQYTRVDTLDAVISQKYSAPERLRGWTTATTEFDLYGVAQSSPNTLQFVISAPGLSVAPEGIKIRSIKIEALQEPITISTIWNKLVRK